MSAARDLPAHDFDPRTYCARLPAPELPPALLDATLHAYRRRRARRTALLATAAGVAMVAGGAVLHLLAPGGSPPQAPPTATVVDVAPIQAPMPTPVPTPVPPSIPAAPRADALRDLDRRLQAAYDAGASDTEVAALWAQRAALAGRDPATVPLLL